ncbi:hypothetical protein J4230_04315 [Candidatus Woesearchaeota archaeon]|nr:hypothetical protein [Candidatus Woesearchaeota archaeon]
MSEIIIAALFGLFGGAIRAAVGLIKYYRINKKTKKFKIIYLITTLIISSVIGMITSLSLTTNHLLNLIIGYAGIDFLENIAKITANKI